MDNSSSIINQLLIGHKLSCEAKYRHALKSRIFSAHFFLCQICNWSKTLFKSLIFRNVLSFRVIERKKIQYEFDCPVLYIYERSCLNIASACLAVKLTKIKMYSLSCYTIAL